MVGKHSFLMSKAHYSFKVFVNFYFISRWFFFLFLNMIFEILIQKTLCHDNWLQCIYSVFMKAYWLHAIIFHWLQNLATPDSQLTPFKKVAKIIARTNKKVNTHSFLLASLKSKILPNFCLFPLHFNIKFKQHWASIPKTFHSNIEAYFGHFESNS